MILLGVVSLLADVSSEMIHPILPVFLVSVLGASYAIVGLIEGLADSLANFLKVLLGWYSDRLHRRKPFVTFGYVPSVIMKPLLALATSWTHVLGIRLFERAGKGVRTAPRDALISDSAPSNRIGAAFGLHRAMDSTGAIIGTIISLILIVFALKSSDPDTMRVLFVLSAIPAALSVIVVVFLVKEKKPLESLAGIKKQGFFDCLRQLEPQLKRFLIVVSVIGFANAGYAFFVLRAESDPIGATLTEILLIYIAMNIVYAGFSIPAGMISDRIGKKPMIIFGLLIFMAAALLMGLAENIQMALFGFLLYGTFLAIGEVNQRAFTSEFASRAQYGTALGAYHTIVGMTALPAGILFGILWDIYGPLASFMFGASMALIAIILLIILVKGKTVQKVGAASESIP